MNDHNLKRFHLKPGDKGSGKSGLIFNLKQTLYHLVDVRYAVPRVDRASRAGEYDDVLRQAVSALQKQHGLSQTGEMDVSTWTALGAKLSPAQLAHLSAHDPTLHRLLVGAIDEASTITVNLRVVKDKQGNATQRNIIDRVTPSLIDDAIKIFGQIKIAFDISYVWGTANRERTKVEEGFVEGALNVFIYHDPDERNSEGVTRGNGAFIRCGAFNDPSDWLLSHELGHWFGMRTRTILRYKKYDAGNLWDDFHIDTSNRKLRNGDVRYGVDWVDDWTKATQPASAWAQGRLGIRSFPRQPTTYDLYRSGARSFSKKE